MVMRWIWRALVMFVGRRAWEAYQRRRAAQRAQTSSQHPQPSSRVR